MRVSLTLGKKIAVGGALVVGLALGTVVSGVGAAKLLPQVSPTRAPHIFPKNVNGETYGSELAATSPSDMPDLVKAVGVGGILGYVRFSDLNGPQPKTPAQAIELMKKRKPGAVRQIPLYAQNGTTVIGVFDVGGAGASTVSQTSKTQ